MSNVAIITPVKNEASNLPALKESLTRQSEQIGAWVIVDDGSDDGSREIVAEFDENTPWIYATDSRSETSRYEIAGVGDVLYTGYRTVEEIGSFDYYMVLDGDMKLTDGYVQTLVEYLEEHPDCKVVSGGIYVREGAEVKLEQRADNQPAGGATLYPAPFMRSIGGPPRYPKWDSIIKARARMNGYHCTYLHTAEEKAIQARKTGSKGNVFKNNFHRGRHDYFLNIRPAVAGIKALHMVATSSARAGVGFGLGYLEAWLRGREKIPDEELREYYYETRTREVKERIYDRLPFGSAR